MIRTLILTVGLPRSGKSTWANTTGFPMVNPDSIRLALHGQAFYAPAEPMVWTITRLMVRSLFKAGHDIVILDATNTTRQRRKEWVPRDGDWYQTLHKVILTPKDVCLTRASDDLKPVIERMADAYEPLTAGEEELTASNVQG